MRNQYPPLHSLRPMPFWAWNGELTLERLRLQIRQMKEMGFGGFFMHSRFGLKTEYLGERWFACVKECIAEAARLELSPFLYDEDRWPSGYAGGKLTALHPEYAQCGIDYEFCSPEKSVPESDIACFALQLEGETVVGWRRVEPGAKLTDQERFCRFFEVPAPVSESLNGGSYIDTFNPAAVQAFLQLVHARYWEELGEERALVPGIFTDEPTYNGFCGKLPWSKLLPERFYETFHVRLEEHLPELFFEKNGKPESKIRLDFYRLITREFVNAYSRQIGDYCRAHNLASTGHVLGEDDLFSQTQAIGSAMRHYEYMEIPGIDVLTEHWQLYLAAKQCVSVARQQDKPVRLAELYGCTGWDFPLEGHVAISDCLNVLGINLMVPHHFFYQMGGESKRDYPASISPHSPWHSIYRAVNDRIDLINRTFAPTREVRRILVIHPQESIWFGRPLEAYGREQVINRNGFFLHTGAEKNAEMNRAQGITDELLRRHLDFDFGDEDQLARWYRVEPRVLHVGKAAYQAVVIPELRTIRRSTLQVLEEFVRQGGVVFHQGAVPDFVDGLPDRAAEVYRFFRSLNYADQEEFRDVSCTLPTGNEAETMLYRLGEGDDRKVLWLCNTSVPPQPDIHAFPAIRDRIATLSDVQISWRIPADYQIYELDVASGNSIAVKARREKGQTRFSCDFDRLQSRIFIAVPEAAFPTISEFPHRVGELPEVPISGPFRYELSEENLLVLDHPRWALPDGEWQPKTYVLLLDAELRKRLGLPPRSIMARQPWADQEQGGEQPMLRLRYTINCRREFRQVRLGIECPEQWRFSWDGVPFEAVDRGYWCDEAIRALELPALTPGRHVLELTTQFGKETALESLFLIGNFAVNVRDELEELPEALSEGDWTRQGFPYYAGNITYHWDFEAAGEMRRFDFSDCVGTAFGVSFNDEPERPFVAPPYECRIETRPGRNHLAFQVYGSRRNALGPFYHRGVPYLITPRTFREYEGSSRQLHHCGIACGKRRKVQS